MRLGTWRTAAAAAALALAASVATAAIPPPAASDGRNRDGFRDPDRSRERSAAGGRRYDRRHAHQGQPPAQFVAELDGRIVVVSAETGRVKRHLTAEKPGGGASGPAVSPDGRWVWFSRSTGRCASHLASVPASGGGAEQRMPGSGEVGPEVGPLPRPGRAQIAYSRRSCDKPGSSLIVGDLGGLEGHARSGLVPVAWNRAGDRLLATTADGDATRLLEISPAGSVVTNRRVEPVDPTPACRLQVVGFSPDDNNGYVAFRRCGPPDERGHRSLVLLDRDGTLRRIVVRLSRAADFTGRPAFDATGHSLLFATVPAATDDAGAARRPGTTLWLWRDGEIRPLHRQTRYRHPVWLP